MRHPAYGGPGGRGRTRQPDRLPDTGARTGGGRADPDARPARRIRRPGTDRPSHAEPGVAVARRAVQRLAEQCGAERDPLPLMATALEPSAHRLASLPV
ncbi:hypothetical protein KCMC57_up40190 [Kitasatospora sp. CMC57]|uniref:Uncharacterized protein n=1 Tax=Kitasatospora sp. CMC57 TaxID=3231513 RepID=A0AB33JYK2_9ACTN